ncbi:MAG: hypothetical protein ACTHOD_21300 [Motilibacteraceae bacterium]
MTSSPSTTGDPSTTSDQSGRQDPSVHGERPASMQGRARGKRVTKQAVLERLHDGGSVVQAASALGVNAGLAYFVATGLPADGSYSMSAGDWQRPGLMTTSQKLSAPPLRQADERGLVAQWMQGRAQADRPMQAAARARDDQGHSDPTKSSRHGSAGSSGENTGA